LHKFSLAIHFYVQLLPVTNREQRSENLRVESAKEDDNVLSYCLVIM